MLKFLGRGDPLKNVRSRYDIMLVNVNAFTSAVLLSPVMYRFVRGKLQQ